MGNLVAGAIIILIYFLFKEYYDKKAFIKSAKLFSEQYNPDAYEIVLGNISPQKETFYYLLQRDCFSFRSLQKNKPDINISDLQYKDLARFRKLISDYSKKQKGDIEIFTNKSTRHLLYPFQQNTGDIEIVLLERPIKMLDDLLKR